MVYSRGVKKETSPAVEQVGSTSLVEVSTPTRASLVETWDDINRKVELSEDFSKDEEAVYWLDSYVIADADVNSFQIYNNEYSHDNRAVYVNGHVKDGSTRKLYQIQGVDVATFRIFGNGYAADKNNAYFSGEEIDGADPETFWVTDLPFVFYAKDKNFAFYKAERLIDIDASSFRILQGSSPVMTYLVDDKKVLLQAWFSDSDAHEMRQVLDADPTTFEVIRGAWARDRTNTYYGTHLIEGSDPATLEILGANDDGPHSNMYAKDKTGVYYTFKRLEGANSETFHAVENVWRFLGNYGEDMNLAYRNGEIFPKQDLAYFKQGKIPPTAKRIGSQYYQYRGGIYYDSESTQAADPLASLDADPATFQILRKGYARDNKNVYYEGRMVTEDLLNNFEILPNSYSKDSHRVYFEGRTIEGADTATFSFIPNSSYVKDKNSVYYRENSEVKKTAADVATFQVILGGNGEYGEDDQHVFMGNKIIDTASPQSFRYLGSGYSTDSTTAFYLDSRLESVDHDSFRVLGNGLSSDDGYHGELIYYSYARDKENVFCEGNILSGADVGSFILKGKNGMPQDKLHRYNRCESVE
jgi:hypothetical protein